MSPFAQVEFLYLGTVVICGLILLFLFSEKSRRTKLSLLVSEKLLPKLIPEWSPFQQKIKFSFMLLCFAMIFIALSRPQWGTRQRTSEPTGIDILVAIDVSKSMLARDVRPNRLERVKLSMTNLMEKVRGDRLGLIAFSGSAFLQCPLTLDHQAFVKTLEDLTIGLIKNPGTNLSKPIDEASRSFSQDDSDRFLILLSDGEDLEGEGLKRAKQAAKEGIRIFTIGIGSKEGDRIPLDPIGQPAQNFLTNPQGETIVSKKDENSLRAIAEATGGVYFPLGPTGEGLERTLQRLQSIGQQKKRELLSSELPIERFFPFALLALILLFIEDLTPSGRKKLTRWGTTCLTLAIILLVGCLKRDNVKNAEDALRDGNPRKAALFYDAEINATRRMDKPIDPKLFLNAGLAHLEAGSLTEANQFLERSLDASVDDPNLQSIGLNALGNLFYRKTNLWLDEQNVGEARRSWEKALKFYDAAFQLDGNEKASANLASLKQQIEKRIQSLVSKVTGKIWRDLNGDGNSQKNEPGLKGFVFWDKDGNGEHNSSNEPSVQTNEDGFFAFEWISSKYPVSLELDSKIEDSNGSTTVRLMPMFPAPPPPLNPNVVKNHLVKIESPGEKLLAIPYRAAPLLIGQVWGDKNGNGIRESTESGFKNATLYLDQNGNFAMDENETTFKPQEDGSFAQPVPPGQYSVCVLPDNPDANVTFPLDARKSYLAWTNFESSSEQLDFGIKDDSEENEQSNAPDQENQDGSSEPSDSPNSQDDSSVEEREPLPQEVNALYERLLQEMESKSEPLDPNLREVQATASGRDY